MTKERCGWLPDNKPDYTHYHDHEWGVPVHDDQKLFEMLILEGAQAGLSWYTILQRREGYHRAFKNFDVKKCAKLTDAELDALMQDEGIIRNRLKIYSVRKNAVAYMAIQQEFGSFDAYLWAFVKHKPQVKRPISMANVTITSAESDALSRDLKKRGMSFVGSTIMYAYMQAVGLVDEHFVSCYKAA